MNLWRTLNDGNKAISWLLIAVILAIVVLPTHMHLHHVDETPSASHHHAMDLHVIYEQLGDGHHDNAAVIDNVTDFLIKQLNDNPLLLAILVILVLTIALVRFFTRHRLVNNIGLRQDCYLLSPPLRAPPIL